ncbi:MAG TPA: hypothetical protein VGD58_21920 [Herpetosiphonaceae bacterium]
MRSITVQEFVSELRAVLQAVTFELSQRQAGVPGAGTVGELELIRNELVEVEAKAASGTLPPHGQRWLAASRIVTDTWPNNSELGNRIVGLATKYRHQLE